MRMQYVLNLEVETGRVGKWFPGLAWMVGLIQRGAHSFTFSPLRILLK